MYELIGWFTGCLIFFCLSLHFFILYRMSLFLFKEYIVITFIMLILIFQMIDIELDFFEINKRRVIGMYHYIIVLYWMSTKNFKSLYWRSLRNFSDNLVYKFAFPAFWTSCLTTVQYKMKRNGKLMPVILR